MKLLFVFALFLLGVAGLWHSQSKKSDCFSPSNVRPTQMLALPSIQSEVTPLVENILQQEFTFLGSGNQCYAFLSQDDQYVLKLIKFHCMQGEKLQPKLKRVLDGFAVAYAYDKEACGLVYMQLTPNGLTHIIRVRDKAGRLHHIEANNLIFALQRKATPTKALLNTHLAKNEISQVHEKIEALSHFLEEGLKRGIYDQDHNVMTNTGFAGELPMRIDFGKLTLNPQMLNPQERERELEKIAEERIQPWVKRHLQINE